MARRGMERAPNPDRSLLIAPGLAHLHTPRCRNGKTILSLKSLLKWRQATLRCC